MQVDTQPRQRKRRSISSASMAIVGLIVVFAVISPDFLSIENAVSILLQSSVLAIIAFGMTMVIISGGMNLSLGAIPSLAGVVCAVTLKAGVSVGFSVMCAIGSGLACGALTGVLIGVFGMPPFIATLGMAGVAEGLALVLSGGGAVFIPSVAIQQLGSGILALLPIPVWIAVIVFAVVLVILKKTVYGTYLLAIGGNEEAARLSGINVARTKLILYSIVGLLAAVAGIVLAGRMNTAHPSGAVGMEFEAVAATVVGGTRLGGGRGSVTGTVLGVLIISILRAGLNMSGLPAPWQMVILGTLITGILVADAMFRNR
jgi:ribose/xylose/arabinose/galactoside ABC-type transport system permease subunit